MKKIILSRQDAKIAKVFLGKLAASPAWTPGEGREQDAKALRESFLKFD